MEISIQFRWTIPNDINVPGLFFCFFDIGFLCVAFETILALALETRLALNSQRSTCLCLPSAGVIGVCHQLQADIHVSVGSLFLE